MTNNIPTTTANQTGPAKYCLYIDESGHSGRSYHVPEEVNDRFLALLGVWFESQTQYRAFSEQMKMFKDDLFGTKQPGNEVILHRKDIIRKNSPFGRLKNDKGFRDAFSIGLLNLVSHAQFKIVSILIAIY